MIPFYIRQLLGSSDNRSNLIKKNIIASLAIKGVSILVSLILVPLTLGYVNTEVFGIWLTLSSIMMWLNFFDIGFTLGLKNRLTEAISLNDYNRGKSLVSTTYIIMVCIFIPLLVILELCSPFINWSRFLNVSEIYNDDIQNAMAILIACFCLQMIVNVFTSVVASFQKTALASLFSVFGNILSLIAIYVLTKIGSPSLLKLAVAISTTPIVIIIIASIYFFKTKFINVAPSFRFVNFSLCRDIFTLGAKFFLIQIQVVILFQSTNFLISNLSGPNDVTYYNIAYKYLGIAMMLYNIILSPLWPAFTNAFTLNDYSWMKRIYYKMIRVYIVSVLVLLVMMSVSPIVYRLWIGEKCIIPIPMTVLVGIYLMIHTWDSLQVYIINGIGKVKLQTIITTIGLTLHLPMSYFLGKIIGLGVYGVISSMILITSFYSLVFTLQLNKLFTRKAFGIWNK